ncbi:MAG TPA: hypothetical protein VEW46_21450 [Pyrinomonadaceae bacterium]|nr:hypothetical protein [Pyrinomonadaceae bacterium]
MSEILIEEDTSLYSGSMSDCRNAAINSRSLPRYKILNFDSVERAQV